MSGVKGLLSIGGKEASDLPATEKFIYNRVTDSARLASAAYNSSLITSTSGTPLQERVFESITSTVLDEDVRGYTGVMDANKNFLTAETAPKLAGLGVKDAARSVLITKPAVDDISKNIKWADDLSATVSSSGVAAIQPMAQRTARRAAPVARGAQRVGVMSRKTLNGVLNAGETAMKVLRGIT